MLQDPYKAGKISKYATEGDMEQVVLGEGK